MKGKFAVTVALISVVGLCSILGSVWTDHVSVMAAEESMVESVDTPVPIGSPMELYTYYHGEYADRYIAYQLKMPDMEMDSVIWRVNAGLDNAPYSLIVEATDEYPLLINKQHKLPDDYEPEELVVIHSSITATPGTAEAFQRMRTAAMGEGVFIEAAAGYHSIERQRELFETQVLYVGADEAEAVVARPGHGEHSTGRALHIVDRNYTFDGFEQLPEYAWLIKNCADYGFILRYKKDVSDITGFEYKPYHFTFVGREVALGMQEMGIATLEEYVARGLAPSGNITIDDRPLVLIAADYRKDGGEVAEGDIALRIKEYLEVERVRVVIVQNNDDIAKEPKASALIGISNADSVGSTVAWFTSNQPGSGSLAETVCNRMAWSGLSVESRGIVEDNKAALARLTEAPAVLLEVSGTDGMLGRDYDERLAKSIADALVAHLGLRKMYLTFDDGPTANHTLKVLEILKEKGVKATFFVVGEKVEQNPEVLKQIVAEGHAVGIHCYSHDYRDLYASVESFTADFDKARECVKEVTGLEPVIYRFPGGSINNYNKEVYEQIIEEMNGRGFVYYDWNISSEDALGTVQPGTLMNTIKAQPRYRDIILLMHDAYPNIIEELSDIIDYYSDYQMDIMAGDTKPVQF